MKLAVTFILSAVVAVAAEDQMRTSNIGAVAFELPTFLVTREEDDALIAHLPQSDSANLRFSAISVRQEGKLVSGAGIRIIRDRAKEEKRELHEERGKSWYTFTEPASEGSSGSTITYWYVGMDSHVVIISCFLDSKEGEPRLKDRVRQSVLPAIRTMRPKDPKG